MKLEPSDTLKLTHCSGLQTPALLTGIDALGCPGVQGPLAGVSSGAAHAFAMHGDTARAIDLWRQSILLFSASRLYGDVLAVRQALNAGILEQPVILVLPRAGRSRPVTGNRGSEQLAGYRVGAGQRRRYPAKLSRTSAPATCALGQVGNELRAPDRISAAGAAKDPRERDRVTIV